MTYYLLSIAAITLVFWFLYKANILAICPICAGTVLTWLAGIVAIYTHASWADPLIVAILMGASMGAVADKYGSRFGLLWKSAAVILGLPAIYFLVQDSLYKGLGLVAIFLIITVIANRKKPANHFHTHHKDLFKECC